MRLAATCLAAVAFAALPASAALYKWTDANGHVVYSDQPPAAANVKTEVLRGAAPAANPNAAKELAQKDAEFRKRQADRAEAAAKADKERAARDQRAAECARVASSIEQLTWGQVVIYRTDEKGRQVPMDEAARQKERARLEAWTRDNCSKPAG
jgi:Skp family chaperone for outer membrane proteins